MHCLPPCWCPFDKRTYSANDNLKMPIIDQEVVGETSSVSEQVPDCPLGIFLENVFRKNIAENGDSPWLVSFSSSQRLSWNWSYWVVKTDVSTGKSMSYIQMVNYMRSVASGLRKRGCNPGDNVVIIDSTHIEIRLMLLGAWRAGGTLSCLSISPTSAGGFFIWHFQPNNKKYWQHLLLANRHTRNATEAVED